MNLVHRPPINKQKFIYFEIATLPLVARNDNAGAISSLLTLRQAQDKHILWFGKLIIIKLRNATAY